ncbi:DUF4184 family protein [Brevibacillus sp. SYSU BS000544]|uniref:DUF4184 family protein n=1 Tax=Brevibacillus sp. SYSU BS000544 TaxID=3416443 RepID=UPI003CE4827F
MPFTFAHPLYAAPFKRVKPRWFSLTGLILGSMSPDFEYFFMLEPYQTIGHTLQGLFFQAIPISVCLALLFHYVVKRQMLFHLPFSKQIRQNISIQRKQWILNTLNKWVTFIVSIIIGFLTHIFIDSFTHVGGYFVVQSTFLQSKALGLPTYKILQHSLSLIGLIVPILLLLNRVKKGTAVQRFQSASIQQKIRYWFIVLLTTLLVLILKLTVSSSENKLGIIVVAPITGFWIGIVISSVVYQWKERMRE